MEKAIFRKNTSSEKKGVQRQQKERKVFSEAFILA
jgi:hypothetical protein